MVEIKLDADTLRLIALFERVTGTRVKDVIEQEERDIFLVEGGHVGRAIGKGAINLKRLREFIQKDIEIVGHDPDRLKFVQNIFHRFQVERIEFDEIHGKGDVARVKVAQTDKGKAIGKGGRNISLARTLIQRHTDLSDVVIE